MQREQCSARGGIIDGRTQRLALGPGLRTQRDTVKPTDDELITAYAGGTADAFDALYARYRERVYRYCYRAVGFDDSQAADCCQEIWLRVIRAADSYRPNNRFDRWLFSLAHNCLVDRVRQSSNTVEWQERDSVELDRFVARFDDCDNLEASLRQLPLLQRSALLLHFTEGYSLAEIAELADTTPETVKSRVRYGLQKLRHWMGAEHVR